MLSGAPARSGIVSVTTICSNGAAARFSKARPLRTGCVAAAKTRSAPASTTASPGRAQRAGGVDHVVDDDRRLAAHVADDVADLGDLLGRALLVEDRQLGAELVGELLVQLHAAGVRRDDDEVGAAPRSSKYCVSMIIAVMWSTGMEKKPWIWPAWRSIVRTRSAPAASSMRATRRAVIGSRGADFLSCRE